MYCFNKIGIEIHNECANYKRRFWIRINLNWTMLFVITFHSSPSNHNTHTYAMRYSFFNQLQSFRYSEARPWHAAKHIHHYDNFTLHTIHTRIGLPFNFCLYFLLIITKFSFLNQSFYVFLFSRYLFIFICV